MTDGKIAQAMLGDRCQRPLGCVHIVTLEDRLNGNEGDVIIAEAWARWGAHGEDTALLVADAQTSGELIFGVDPAGAGSVVSELGTLRHTAAVVGNLTKGSDRIRLR